VRALITNDDGIQSRGIHELTRVAIAAGLDVQIAAPHTERSGSSAALSALAEGGRLLVERQQLEGLDGVRAQAVQATPAMIAFAAARGAFGARPDVVLSGINHGPNTGTAILHSGTVGAAFTAAAHGIPALAVSLASSRPTHWDTAAEFAARGLSWFLQHADDAYVLNVNVPDVPADQCRRDRRPADAGHRRGAAAPRLGHGDGPESPRRGKRRGRLDDHLTDLAQSAEANRARADAMAARSASGQSRSRSSSISRRLR
jgi:5'-nucleotidase